MIGSWENSGVGLNFLHVNIIEKLVPFIENFQKLQSLVKKLTLDPVKFPIFNSLFFDPFEKLNSLVNQDSLQFENLIQFCILYADWPLLINLDQILSFEFIEKGLNSKR